MKGRAVVRQIVHLCVICRRFEGKAYQTPHPPPLPGFRVTEAPPFTFTGVDYAGPLYVKNGGEGKDNRALKSHSLGVRLTHFDMISLSQDLYLLSHSFQITFSLILTHFIILIIIFFFSCNSTASLSFSLVVILICNTISKPSTI